MEPYVDRNTLATSLLLQALTTETLGHASGKSAVSILLGGEEWIEVIEPRTGTVDHKNKMAHPRLFAQGLRLIENADYSIEEVIAMEARFEGRKSMTRDGQLYWVSTLDDSNDPDGAQGLHAVFQYLSYVAPVEPREQIPEPVLQ